MNPLLLAKIKEAYKADKAIQNAKYHQADKGEKGYGHGDIFVGITVPAQRLLVKEFAKIVLREDVLELLCSPIHEYRSMALLFLVEQFQKSKDKKQREEIVEIYLKHTVYINNWDLVDKSAPYILGEFVWGLSPDISLLSTLAKSLDIWEKRIAIVSTLFFIKKGLFGPTLELVPLIWESNHIMVQKGLGWMIKEISERDLDLAIHFTKENLEYIKPIALTIAKEKFPTEIKNTLKYKGK